MDSFQTLVSMLLQRDGYWVRGNFKVELTKEEKRAVGRYSTPRWELDLVAYKGSSNEILMVECKSFLDSPGVRFRGFDGSAPDESRRYKLFNDEILRQVVTKRLVTQLEESGACALSPSVRLCLAAGKIASAHDRENLREHFARNGWLLFDEEWTVHRLEQVSNSGYEDDVAAVVAKLLTRRVLRIDKIAAE